MSEFNSGRYGLSIAMVACGVLSALGAASVFRVTRGAVVKGVEIFDLVKSLAKPEATDR